MSSQLLLCQPVDIGFLCSCLLFLKCLVIVASNASRGSCDYIISFAHSVASALEIVRPVASHCNSEKAMLFVGSFVVSHSQQTYLVEFRGRSRADTGYGYSQVCCSRYRSHTNLFHSFIHSLMLSIKDTVIKELELKQNRRQ